MIFMCGPRQVGKTILAKAILTDNYPDGRYMNWDFDDNRQDILLWGLF
jgi:predicted AAA+ superfamily ATPase